jgi:hypothetical protein
MWLLPSQVPGNVETSLGWNNEWSMEEFGEAASKP